MKLTATTSSVFLALLVTMPTLGTWASALEIVAKEAADTNDRNQVMGGRIKDPQLDQMVMHEGRTPDSPCILCRGQPASTKNEVHILTKNFSEDLSVDQQLQIVANQPEIIHNRHKGLTNFLEGIPVKPVQLDKEGLPGDSGDPNDGSPIVGKLDVLGEESNRPSRSRLRKIDRPALSNSFFEDSPSDQQLQIDVNNPDAPLINNRDDMITNLLEGIPVDTLQLDEEELVLHEKSSDKPRKSQLRSSSPPRKVDRRVQRNVALAIAFAVALIALVLGIMYWACFTRITQTELSTEESSPSKESFPAEASTAVEPTSDNQIPVTVV